MGSYITSQIAVETTSIVMAGLVPAIHVFGCCDKKDVDARDKRGHDVERSVFRHYSGFHELSRNRQNQTTRSCL
jgi:hypothetical protein